jgi:putative heme-binding domain-containing protein
MALFVRNNQRLDIELDQDAVAELLVFLRDDVMEVLAPSQPPQLQQMAVATLIEIATPDVPARLTEGWSQYGPQLRAQVLDALLTRPAWGNHLLQELEEGRITVGQLSAAHRDQLLRHPDPAFGQRIEQLLGRPTRQLDQVLLHYADAIPLALDGERDLDVGHRLFQQRCASCHRLDGVGGEVGPDLGSLANRSPPALLTAIVDPNRAIEARYLQYQVLTTDGQVLTGLLAEETTHSLRLVSADGKVIELLRSSVDQLHCTERSMMPEGLEDGLTVPQLADLIHYVMRPAGGSAQSSDTTAEPARP